MGKTVLLAGGAGYIGSHTSLELLEKGYDIVIADCHYNSSPVVYDRLEKLSGRTFRHYDVDVADYEATRKVFEENTIDAIIDFAGYKAVGESVQKPLMYYENNLNTTFVLLKLMKEYQVDNIIFSSSATVYGMDNVSPLTEEMRLGPCTNPYGWTKFMNEQILKDEAKANERLSVVLLRYFNPVGAHASGEIGEDPKGIPNNLMPFVSQVAAGRLEKLRVFGDDYDTKDGTGVRDFIHVVDLAKAHVCAVDYAFDHKGTECFNIGTGDGYSVLELVHAFEKVNDLKIPHEIVGRRDGDVAACYADSSKAERVLGWKAEKNLEDMCRDTWKWQSQNPNGYEGQ